MNAAVGHDHPVKATASEGDRGSIPREQVRGTTGPLDREVSTPATSQMPMIAIRSPNNGDISSLAALFSEMQAHYRRPVADEQAFEAATLASQPVKAMFDPRVLVASGKCGIVGCVVLNVTFPAFELSRALYIRDLYVVRSMRRAGVGQALVKAAARLTYAHGFSALDWTTETDNIGARQMYESCGARVLPRTYYRLAREDMKASSQLEG